MLVFKGTQRLIEGSVVGQADEEEILQLLVKTQHKPHLYAWICVLLTVGTTTLTITTTTRKQGNAFITLHLKYELLL